MLCRHSTPLLLLDAGFAAALAVCVPGNAQPTKLKAVNLVSPNGKGRIVVPLGDQIKWEHESLYDNGTRPVIQFDDAGTHVIISYSLFANQTGSAAPQICRDDALNAALKGLSTIPGVGGISKPVKEDRTTAAGDRIATGSYFVATAAGQKVAEQNLFGIASSATTCAEVHISLTSYKAAAQPSLDTVLNSFHFDPDYVPIAQDYFLLGTVYYEDGHVYEAAAVYYQRALDTLPPNAPLNSRRVLIDQLSMSYGIGGQIARSRAVNEAAIKIDPDYPLYYYNLACADAEEGKAADAKLHLQQAFDRKANTLPGEHLPDPAQDDSIQKLRNNKEFWAFVGTLR